jgi:predicted MFS family arabinose efflux permease
MFATFAGESGFLDSILTPSYSFNEAFFKKTYGFAPSVGGLAYLGLGVGFFLATIFGAKFADQIYKNVSFYSTVRKKKCQ